MEKRKRLNALFGLALAVVFPGPAAGSPQGDCDPVRFALDEAGRIVVPVSINGTGPYSFLLDTGAPVSKVDKKLGVRLGLRPVSGVPLLTFTGTRTVPLVRLTSLAIGPRAVANVLALHCDLGRLFALGAAIQGVVGQDFLSRCNYMISYRDRAIRFEEAGELRSELKGVRIPSERKQGRHYLPVRTRSAAEPAVPFLLDSGSPYVLIFAPPSADIGFDLVRIEANDLVAVTSIGRRRLRPCRLASLQVGDTSLENLKAMLAPLLPGESHPQKGMLPLSLFDAVYFNNKENFVILKPRPEYVAK